MFNLRISTALHPKCSCNLNSSVEMKDAKRFLLTLKLRIIMKTVSNDLLGVLALLYTSFPRLLSMLLFVS